MAYCLWCGACLAGSFTQHSSECWLYAYTKDVRLPDEVRDRLKSLARIPNAWMEPFAFIEDAEAWMDENASGPISVLIKSPPPWMDADLPASRWTLEWEV